jgi:hypothetical protein
MTGHYLLQILDVQSQKSLAGRVHGQDTRNLIVKAMYMVMEMLRVFIIILGGKVYHFGRRNNIDCKTFGSSESRIQLEARPHHPA